MPDMTVINQLNDIRERYKASAPILDIHQWSQLSPIVTRDWYTTAANDSAFLLDLVEKLQTTVAAFAIELNAHGVSVRQS